MGQGLVYALLDYAAPGFGALVLPIALFDGSLNSNVSNCLQGKSFRNVGICVPVRSAFVVFPLEHFPRSIKMRSSPLTKEGLDPAESN